MSKTAIRPYLIAKDEEGKFRITVRVTRFNSQGYPLVSATVMDGTFPSATSARAHLRENYRAETTDIATK